MMKYAVIYEKADDGGIWAYAPDLPGATGHGDTMAEAERSIRDGITIWIHDARASGEAVPAPSTHVGVVDIPAA